MFTTCLFVIVTSITTDTTSKEQSNNTGTNNYPLFNRRILNLFIFLSIIFRIVNLVPIKIVHFNPSILNLRAVHASRNLPNPTAYFHTRFISPSPRKIFLMSCGEIGTVWWVEAAIQSLFHRNLVVTYGPGGRRSGRRRSRRLRGRSGKVHGRFGVRRRASWLVQTREAAESALRRAVPR